MKYDLMECFFFHVIQRHLPSIPFTTLKLYLLYLRAAGIAFRSQFSLPMVPWGIRHRSSAFCSKHFFLTCRAISPAPQIQHYKARTCLLIFLRYPCDFHSPKYAYFPRDQKPQVPSRSGTKASSFTGAEISMSEPLGFRWNRGCSKWEETSASF